MNIKFLAFAPLLLLAACSNDETIKEEVRYPITFNVQGLEVNYEPVAKSAVKVRAAMASTPLNEKFSTLEYMGFSSNAQVFRGTQTYNAATPDEFGTIGAQAPAGNYYLGFFGVGEGVGSYNISLGTAFGDNDYISSTGREIWYKEFKGYSIPTTTNNIAVEMTRKTGRIVLNVTDKVPADAKRVKIEIYYSSRYKITSGTPTISNSSVYSTDIPIAADTLSSFQFNCFPITGAIVNLYIYDANNVQLDQKNLNVTVYENRKTIISGSLFSNVGGKAFTVTVSDAWGEDNLVGL